MCHGYRQYNVGNNQTEFRFNISDDNEAADKLVIGVTWAGDGQWYPKLVVQGDGNVGIGTNMPQSNLEIKSVNQFDASTVLRITNNVSDYGRANLVITGRLQDGNDIWRFGTLARNSIVFAENAASSGQNIGSTGDEKYSIQLEGNSNALGFLSKQNGNTPNMMISQNGNVGIGTFDNNNWQLANSPHKLAVGGTVIVEAVTVKLQSSWPDYIFDDKYKLQPLAEIKKYIDQNHHLPGMPSAKRVEKEGLDLGEMNKLLLKKVEELTLYLIEQQKEIEQLKKQKIKKND